MYIDDFDFDLPEELIAQTPAAERTGSRLLYLDGNTGATRDHAFPDLLDYLQPGDVLVFNNTRVIKARLFGLKSTGGQVEVLVERILNEREALAHCKASKSPKPGTRIRLADAFEVEVTGREGALFRLVFPDPVDALLERYGRLPLPPYIAREAGGEDEQRYQTVYASEAGAVAAPTAGLHFDEALLARLDAHGVERAFVTLHVGAGTFQPVRVAKVEDHQMHQERYHVPEETVALIARARADGHRVMAVGTTSLRALEGAARGGDLQAGWGETDIFITPGYRFRVVDRLLTNFHLPKSTLMLLVSALAGQAEIKAAYAHAVRERYRFFSYGDAMLIDPKNEVKPR